jgi:hypothetical protein
VLIDDVAQHVLVDRDQPAFGEPEQAPAHIEKLGLGLFRDGVG